VDGRGEEDEGVCRRPLAAPRLLQPTQQQHPLPLSARRCGWCGAAEADGEAGACRGCRRRCGRSARGSSRSASTGSTPSSSSGLSLPPLFFLSPSRPLAPLPSVPPPPSHWRARAVRWMGRGEEACAWCCLRRCARLVLLLCMPCCPRCLLWPAGAPCSLVVSRRAFAPCRRRRLAPPCLALAAHVRAVEGDGRRRGGGAGTICSTSRSRRRGRRRRRARARATSSASSPSARTRTMPSALSCASRPCTACLRLGGARRARAGERCSGVGGSVWRVSRGVGPCTHLEAVCIPSRLNSQP
jgi:hypothetical protein